MSLVFRICTLSVVIGLSACGQSDDRESSSPSSGDNNSSQPAPLTMNDGDSPAESAQPGSVASGCEYFEQLQEMVPDDDTIDGLDRATTRCMDASAKVTYQKHDARYVFVVQALNGDSPLMEPYIESMSDAPESIVKQIQSAISVTGEMFRAMHGTCEELSEADYLPPEMPTPVVESGICVMKDDDQWTARKLFSEDVGLFIEYHGEAAEALNDSQQAAQKLSPLFEKFSTPGR